MLFPPHLNYVRINILGEKVYIPMNIFLKYAERYMYELKNYLPNQSLLMLTNKSMKKVNRRIKKMRKFQKTDNFKEISIIQVIEN